MRVSGMIDRNAVQRKLSLPVATLYLITFNHGNSFRSLWNIWLPRDRWILRKTWGSGMKSKHSMLRFGLTKRYHTRFRQLGGRYVFVRVPSIHKGQREHSIEAFIVA